MVLWYPFIFPFPHVTTLTPLYLSLSFTFLCISIPSHFGSLTDKFTFLIIEPHIQTIRCLKYEI